MNVIQWELMTVLDAQYSSWGCEVGEREKTLFLWYNYLMKYNYSSLRESCYIPVLGWFGFWSGCCLFAAYQACKTSEILVFLAAAKFYLAIVVREQDHGGGKLGNLFLWVCEGIPGLLSARGMRLGECTCDCSLCCPSFNVSLHAQHSGEPLLWIENTEHH